MRGGVGKREKGATGEAPSSKNQAPEKLQTPSFKAPTRRGLGAWSLVLLWRLVFGAWRFFPVAGSGGAWYIESVLNTLKKSNSAPSASPAPFGRFYLQELINRGGMADIWLATDAKGKPYALRRLHERLRFNFLARRRFLRGCEILEKIHDHEGIIGYVEHGKISGLLYLLMEYV